MVQERFAAEQNKGCLSYKARDKREGRDRHKKREKVWRMLAADVQE
jgi:hypothetical protein